MSKAKVYLWTGDGWGKSTSAFGAAVRSLGHGYKVAIVQFMKGWKERVGEYKFFKREKNVEIEQFGSKRWVNLSNPSEDDKKRARKALQHAKNLAKKKPFLLILDEINLAVSIGLLSEKEVIDFLDSIKPPTHIYLTGRYATEGLKRRANYVNTIIMEKGPKNLRGEKGIDY